MRVTLKEVAKRADVNFTLVSKYINQTQGVRMRPETQERIRKAIRELDYHPISTARALRCGRTNTLGLVVGNLTNEYFAHYADLAIMEAEKLGFRLLLAVCKNGEPQEAIQNLYVNQVDGIVCCDCFNPGPAPCLMLTERSFFMDSMKTAMGNAIRYLKKNGCTSMAGVFTDNRWLEIFSDREQTALTPEIRLLPRDPSERDALLREICRKRPDAIFSSGWKTVNRLSDILTKEFPGYDPRLIVWANCQGPFLKNPRIRGVLHTSTKLSIKETFASLANMIKSTGEIRRPELITCRFIPRENRAYNKLVTETFSLT